MIDTRCKIHWTWGLTFDGKFSAIGLDPETGLSFGDIITMGDGSRALRLWLRHYRCRGNVKYYLRIRKLSGEPDWNESDLPIIVRRFYFNHNDSINI
jgi:hypothetical protein